MGRENVIAGTDCGYGNRVYPDIGWAKMRAVAEGAALASQQLWPRGSCQFLAQNTHPYMPAEKGRKALLERLRQGM